MAADILEFQEVLIEDDGLTAPAFAAIAEGLSADAAWTLCLDREIAEYAAAGDAYMAARARGPDRPARPGAARVGRARGGRRRRRRTGRW